jgi:hypothetical protein
LVAFEFLLRAEEKTQKTEGKKSGIQEVKNTECRRQKAEEETRLRLPVYVGQLAGSRPYHWD